VRPPSLAACRNCRTKYGCRGELPTDPLVVATVVSLRSGRERRLSATFDGQPDSPANQTRRPKTPRRCSLGPGRNGQRLAAASPSAAVGRHRRSGRAPPREPHGRAYDRVLSSCRPASSCPGADSGRCIRADLVIQCSSAGIWLLLLPTNRRHACAGSDSARATHLKHEVHQ
jgi:hypothetical protein